MRWGLAAIVLAGAAVAAYRMMPGRGTGDALPGAASAASAAASAPPVSVATVRAAARDVPVLLQATGSVMAVNSVEVRPQIGSVVTKVHFREGQFVKAGELLFTLDSRADEANVAKAQAQLQKNQAALADAQRQLARSRELFAQNFISQGAVDTNQALVDGQNAGVAADRAALEAARVNLGYSRIVAPSSGRAGAVNVFAGSTVQANQTTLVTITQLDPILVSFSLPQRYLPDVLAALADGGSVVTAALPAGGTRIEGRLRFVDNTVDASTGTVRVKAIFDNKDQRLWPGAFVNVELTARTLKDAVVVPQAAVVQGPRGRNVYVVGPDNKALQKPVDVVLPSGADAVVTGIEAGERVVVDGRQNLRPGSRVVERAPGRAGAASGAASGPASGVQP
jgi:RND family efflux transporter MFP subunit